MENIATLEHAIRALRDDVRAPARLAPVVLAETGIADRYALATSPVGEVFVAYNAAGISALELADDAEEFERHFIARFGRRAFRAPGFPAVLARAIERRLSGERVRPPFDLRAATPFQRAVLLKALEIPLGEVRPYGWVAREIGTPRAVRAVGSALGANPIPLLIPCHRVVRGDGTLGQYSMGGPEVKVRLLEIEGAAPALAAAQSPLVGSDTTRIFCYPTCRHARRVMPAHLVRFGGIADAESHGYRACKVCRPA